MADKKRVAIALSGGVDSSVCALMLKNQGYEVIGITGKMADDENFDLVCKNAKSVAEKLGIEHYILDLSKEFKEKIIDYFVNSYKNGLTPNPCILCNKLIKWGAIFDYALYQKNCDYIATGHYANIKKVNDKYLLYPANDTKKDQLYYLFELNQNQLSKTIFPLSNYEKSEIKQIAIENDLPCKDSKESQDICFIKKPCTTKKFLLQNLKSEKGCFILKKTGEKIGIHEGFFQYTIGQRKGIGIAYSEPLYVVGINAEKNEVLCGVKSELYSDSLILNSYNLIDEDFYKKEVLIKIRYNMDFVEGVFEKENEKLLVKFKEPVSAVTKGQACVFYSKKDGHLIGGGWI